MSENPHPEHTDPSMVFDDGGRAYRCWNEGYNAALDAAVEALWDRRLGQTAVECIKALRKKVTP